jgi:hypothetical protein
MSLAFSHYAGSSSVPATESSPAYKVDFGPPQPNTRAVTCRVSAATTGRPTCMSINTVYRVVAFGRWDKGRLDHPSPKSLTVFPQPLVFSKPKWSFGETEHHSSKPADGILQGGVGPALGPVGLVPSHTHTYARPSRWPSSISSSRRGSPGRPPAARVEGVFVRPTPIGTAPATFQRIMTCKCSLTGGPQCLPSLFWLESG